VELGGGGTGRSIKAPPCNQKKKKKKEKKDKKNFVLKRIRWGKEKNFSALKPVAKIPPLKSTKGKKKKKKKKSGVISRPERRRLGKRKKKKNVQPPKKKGKRGKFSERQKGDGFAK